MHKCHKCGTEFEGKICPECGTKRTPQFISLFLLRTHSAYLTPDAVKKARTELLETFTAILFFLFSIALLFCLLAPAAEIVATGTMKENDPMDVYQLLSYVKDLSKDSPDELKTEIKTVLNITTAVIAIATVSCALSVLCLLFKWKFARFTEKINPILNEIPYLFYLGGLIFGCLFLTKILAVGELTVPSKKCGVAILTVSAVALAVSRVADLIKSRYKTISGYRLCDPKRHIILHESACLVNDISAQTVSGIHRVLRYLPAILVALFSLAFFVACFVPGNFLTQLKNAQQAISSLTEKLSLTGDSAEKTKLTAEIATEQSIVSSVIAILVFLSIGLAGTLANLCYRLVRRPIGEHAAIRAIPYIVYVLFLILGIALARPLMTSSDFLLKILLPCVCFFLLTCFIDYERYYLETTYDFRNLSDMENVYGYNENFYRFNVLNGVEKIGDYAFHDCRKLSSVVVADSVESLGTSAFETCPILSWVVLGQGVQEIGSYAFLDCISLETIILPAGLKKIGDYAFYNCRQLKSISFAGTKAEWETVLKGKNWDQKIGSHCVRCSDGDIVTSA